MFLNKIFFLELLYKQQQIYLAPQPIEIPYYLCIKTSMHSDDIPSLHAKQSKKSDEKFADETYGKKHLEYEYWFAVPKEKYEGLIFNHTPRFSLKTNYRVDDLQ